MNVLLVVFAVLAGVALFVSLAFVLLNSAIKQDELRKSGQPDTFGTAEKIMAASVVADLVIR